MNIKEENLLEIMKEYSHKAIILRNLIVYALFQNDKFIHIKDPSEANTIICPMICDYGYLGKNKLEMKKE